MRCASLFLALASCALSQVKVGVDGAARDIAFTATADQTEQRYVILLPRQFDAGSTVNLLIALHGHGSDRWQFMTPSRDETRAALDIAAKHRMIYVAPDYRARTSWMGPRAESDLLQIIADLKREFRVGKVFLCGGSMGGSSALTFTALHPDLIDGVVAMNATANHLEYDNFQDAIAASFGGTKKTVPLEYKRRSAEYYPERFTMPVALTACGADKSVPPGSVMRLASVLEKLNRKVLLVYRENEGHATKYADAVQAFEFVLAAAGAKRRHGPQV
jgi:pimeloyl-ACP methyl ester carboxylesterase